MTTPDEHRRMLRDAWDEYQPAYMEFHLAEWPDFHRRYAEGAVTLDPRVVELVGDVSGLSVLDTCCACDAGQAFSFENLGARVTACDLSPKAIEIARANAETIGSSATFHVADAQTLEPVADGSIDLVYATFLCWYEDLLLACRNWHRVLRPGGRLQVTHGNPVAGCLETADGRLRIARDYFDPSPEYYRFDGTPIAEPHGGWQGTEMIVEFFHRTEEVVNAVASAGFRITRMMEFASWDDEQRDAPEPDVPRLPCGFMLLAEKLRPLSG